MEASGGAPRRAFGARRFASAACYKFRECSYFLQQAADAIEEEANAVPLGIGPYSECGAGREGEALKLFTQRVEEHRNEQRRRQQQLDQPADQAAPTGQPSAP
ncbi:hypothetical protein [Streptomyces hypolithicus]